MSKLMKEGRHAISPLKLRSFGVTRIAAVALSMLMAS